MKISTILLISYFVVYHIQTAANDANTDKQCPKIQPNLVISPTNVLLASTNETIAALCLKEKANKCELVPRKIDRNEKYYRSSALVHVGLVKTISACVTIQPFFMKGSLKVYIDAEGHTHISSDSSQNVQLAKEYVYTISYEMEIPKDLLKNCPPKYIQFIFVCVNKGGEYELCVLTDSDGKKKLCSYKPKLWYQYATMETVSVIENVGLKKAAITLKMDRACAPVYTFYHDDCTKRTEIIVIKSSGRDHTFQIVNDNNGETGSRFARETAERGRKSSFDKKLDWAVRRRKQIEFLRGNTGSTTTAETTSETATTASASTSLTTASPATVTITTMIATAVTAASTFAVKTADTSKARTDNTSQSISTSVIEGGTTSGPALTRSGFSMNTTTIRSEIISQWESTEITKKGTNYTESGSQPTKVTERLRSLINVTKDGRQTASVSEGGMPTMLVTERGSEPAGDTEGEKQPIEGSKASSTEDQRHLMTSEKPIEIEVTKNIEQPPPKQSGKALGPPIKTEYKKELLRTGAIVFLSTAIVSALVILLINYKIIFSEPIKTIPLDEGLM